MRIEYWIVIARDEHHIFGGSGWSYQLAGSKREGHPTKAEAEAELAEILATASFDAKDLKVEKRYRNG